MKNPIVTTFLDELNHPLRSEIELLRQSILGAHAELSESIKWNSPNYIAEGQDRITMRVRPETQIQLIFHCGAKKREVLSKKLIVDDGNLLEWKENDRAVATFKNNLEIENSLVDLKIIVADWISAG